MCDRSSSSYFVAPKFNDHTAVGLLRLEINQGNAIPTIGILKDGHHCLQFTACAVTAGSADFPFVKTVFVFFPTFAWALLIFFYF